MARDNRIYRHRKRHGPWKLVLQILLGLVVLAIALNLFFYFYFQRYIVYTEHAGIYLDIPWLYDIEGEPEYTPAPNQEEFSFGGLWHDEEPLPTDETFRPDMPKVTPTATPTPDPNATPVAEVELEGVPETAADGTAEETDEE